MSRARFIAIAFVIAIAALPVGSAAADFHVENVESLPLTESGTIDNRASAHPFEQRIEVKFPTKLVNGVVTPDGSLKDLEIDLPPGLVGDPSTATVCSMEDFETQNEATVTASCPDGSQVGTVTFITTIGGAETFAFEVPLYNQGAQDDTPAEFGWAATGFRFHPKAVLRTGGDNGVTIVSRDLAQNAPLVGTIVRLWGVPSDPAHDESRNRLCALTIGYCTTEGQPTQWPRLPFLTTPSNCSAAGLTTGVRADSWQEPGIYRTKSYTAPPPVGCENLSFTPSFDAQPDNHRAGAPSGYSFDLEVPLNRNPDGLSVPPLKRVVATLPEGTTISPAGADGLQACSAAQIGINNAAKPTCPESSAVGDATLETPLLPAPMKGTLYLAKPHENPFDSLYGIYLVLERYGALLKLPGKVEADPQTGRITTTFDNNPQLPFTNLDLHFGGGSHAILSNPTGCGTKSMTMQLESWAGQSVTATSKFDIDQNCNRGFAPKMEAGSQNPVAGAASPFLLRLQSGENEAPLKSIDLDLPPGLLAKLKGIPYCSDAALAAISSQEGTGTAELANPHCPAASQVGTATVGAGPGSTPLFVSGKAYLAGPYKGAPLSLAIVTPAISGPYDLGTVVVRNALKIDPVTTQVEAVSDPLPTILYGVPLGLRDVRINLDRTDFTVNPTNCERMAVGASIGSSEAPSWSGSSPFQVGECAALGLKPKLALRFSGAPTRRGGHPKLTATLTTGKDESNLSRVQVTLPKTEYLENAHIRTVCTRVQYAANQCPVKSIYGYAKAWTPLLDKPLEGPVYLRSSSHKLPDLVASLDGQIHVDLDGRISSNKARIRNTFDLVPDAPVTKFVLTMQGGGKGLLVNNTNICKTKPVAEVEFNGQNGKVHEARPQVAVGGCGKKGAKPKKQH
jgi:hypothetical protein